jgi:NAD(P)-dependent dehydrogenase (short-subunit alcohol dehydrogenase family)
LNEGSLQAAKETLGAGSLAVRADVSNLTDLDTMFATIKREFGHLDGVFVNAGYSEFLLFEEVTEQSFDKVIAVNFKGAYFTIQKALRPPVRKRELDENPATEGRAGGRVHEPRPRAWGLLKSKGRPQ